MRVDVDTEGRGGAGGMSAPGMQEQVVEQGRCEFCKRAKSVKPPEEFCCYWQWSNWAYGALRANLIFERRAKPKRNRA